MNGASAGVPGPSHQAHSSQYPSTMKNEETERRVGWAAAMITFGVTEIDIAAILRAEGASEEAIFLALAAAELLAW